ncbi:AAA family ATPase [Micromonospora echinofusca]|uniref:AAA family ATPase n=1 Tax=Micromonospora echinofusca TaxID=47858 RepID=UPI00341804F4
MRCYVLTGAPGAGKTTLAEAPEAYARVRIHDRPPLCTLALARHLGRPPGRVLVEEVQRVLRDGAYERPIFLVQPLGFVTPSAARRKGYAESLTFARVHEEIYRAHGHRLIPVPPAPVQVRVALVETHLRHLAGLLSERTEGVSDPVYLT